MGRKKKMLNKKKMTVSQDSNKNVSTSGVNNNSNRMICHPQVTKMLDIFARLSFPLKVPSVNLPVSDDDEEVLEFEMRPRLIYVSSLCSVCMELSSKISCDQCKMLFYCSERHKVANKEKHRALCGALRETCQQGMEGFSLAKGLSPHLYRSFRIKTIELVEVKLNRRLDLWEKEIILYPKICRSCKSIDDNLICCPICSTDFYCQMHKANHDVWCKEFQLFRRILWLQSKHGFIEPDIPNLYYKEPKIIPDNMDIFLYSLYENNSSYNLIDSYTYASLSYLATVPLTTLFAIQKTIANWSTRESMTIHIVGAEFQFECSCLKIWEKFLLHFLPNLKVLSLKFIGPELYLPPAPIELLSKVSICNICKLNGKKINISYHPQTLYHNIEDSSLAPAADLICLFNPGLYRETGFDGTDTWPKTIIQFCSAKVPVVVTAYTDFEIPRDIDRIKSVSNISILLEPQRNPFSSLKPDRNFVSDDVVPFMYKNHCVAIVKGI